ncbi:MAG: hypothetical protein SFZ24_11830, partial [Planctomycetota bacterium]|nr:hypothetical protein [Planctomycetota bacterium]
MNKRRTAGGAWMGVWAMSCVLASAWCGAAAARGQSGEPGGAGAPGAERAAEEAQKLPPQVIVGR